MLLLMTHNGSMVMFSIILLTAPTAVKIKVSTLKIMLNRFNNLLLAEQFMIWNLHGMAFMLNNMIHLLKHGPIMTQFNIFKTFQQQ